jgi:hypothetical protein
MLFANRATWAHAICAAAEAAGLNVGRLLDGPELQAVKGSGDPRVIMNSY